MRKVDVTKLSVDELVERYVAISVDQYEAEDNDNIRKYNRLVDDLIAAQAELKSRAGDQRTALMKLYDHPNMQVRLECCPRHARGGTGGGQGAAARHPGVAVDAAGHAGRDVATKSR